MPKISVIMPAYNAEQYIGEAMDSILGQTFGDFEFIILNDCSADGTEEIILSYDDPRIVYLKNERNLGVAATLNRGLEMARGEYIARMDADDISLPHRFEKQIAYLDAHPEVAVLGTNAAIFSDDKTIQMTQVPETDRSIRFRMALSNPFIHPTIMMRRSMIAELSYEMEYEGREDYRFWMRVSQKYKVSNLRDCLLRYRIHKGQVTRRADSKKKEKHFSLKKRYYQELQIGLTEPIETALCWASFFGTVEAPEQLRMLKTGLRKVAEYYGEKGFPKEYENFLTSVAVNSKIGKLDKWKITEGQPFVSRIATVLRKDRRK